MIVLRSQLTLKNKVSAKAVWSAISQWRKQSKNTSLVLREWFNEHPFEKLSSSITEQKDSKTVLSVYKPNETSFAFRLQEGAVITSICFDIQRSDCNFTIEIERTDNQQRKISRPKIFEYLEQFLDKDIYAKTAHSETNNTVLANLICQKGKIHNLPVVYISETKDNEYLLNPNKLAEELFGIAVVYKETDYSVSETLSDLTGGRAAYNGAVGIYYGNKRTIIAPANVRDYEYFYRISKLSILIPRDEHFTWYGMVMPYLQKVSEKIKSQTETITKQVAKITFQTIIQDIAKSIKLANSEKEKKNLQTKLDELEEKLTTKDQLIENLRQELNAEKAEKENIQQELDKRTRDLENLKNEFDEYPKTFDYEIQEKQNKINELIKENEKLNTYKIAFEKKRDGNQDINIFIKCSEHSLYPNEIENFVKGLIYNVAKSYEKYNGGTKKDEKGFIRIYHVLKSIFDNNPDFDFLQSDTYKRLQELDKIPQTDKDCVKLLEKCGFELERTANHNEMFLCGDSRYSVTTPKTRSDKHSIENTINYAKKCFLDLKSVKLY
ncbi:MAG: hypothetical protein IKQ61_03015 [Spirochaetales bacterium]|nr:hypothetical protein [Spirochaetales bacterium]